MFGKHRVPGSLRQDGLQLGISLVILFLTRLPLLLDEQLIADGDESIVGLMAKHALEGKGWPLFFYGQDYGLSILEVATVSVFFRFKGLSTVALKLAMLVLWGIGFSFFASAVRNFFNRKTSIVASILLIVCPAWFLWSMKARGGYVTGFLVSQVFMWLLSLMYAQERPKKTWIVYLGMCLGTLYYSQVIWLIVTLPFLLLFRQKAREPKYWILLSSGVVLSVILVRILRAVDDSQSYWFPQLFGSPSPMRALKNLPSNILISLSGAYEYEPQLLAFCFIKWAAMLWFVLLVLDFCFALTDFQKRCLLGVSQVCCLSILTLLLFSIFVSPEWFAFRYFLPLSIFVLIPASHKIAEGSLLKKGVLPLWVLHFLLVCFGILSIWEVRPSRVRLHPESSIAVLTGELVDRQIFHVYSLSPTLQWQIMFYSHEQVKARWIDPKDRVPFYPSSVDRALFAGNRVALVGERFEVDSANGRWDRLGIPESRLARISNYFIFENPSPQMLEKLGFQLNSP